MNRPCLNRKFALLLLPALGIAQSGGNAQANLAPNGDFAANGGPGQLTVNTTLSDWTGGGKEGGFGSQTTPPVFIFPASGGSVNGDAFMGSVGFYGNPTSPDGNSFIAADGDSAWAGSISQTISGLNAGSNYTLTFNWAGAQQLGFSGNTTEAWQVSLGSQTQSTATVNTPSQTFVGWQTASLSFAASSPSELLKFTAIGAPGGEPPWLLLDNVNLTAPEPVASAIFSVGFVGFMLHKRRARAKA